MNNSEIPPFEGAFCPMPLKHEKTVVIGHGSGGRMTHELIADVFKSAFGNPILNSSNDYACLPLPGKANLKGRLSVSTDAHVVNPIIFPGGDIGRLAVAGTVNDVCMSGGLPLFLTASFIIEEGLPIETLRIIALSMKDTAIEAEVEIIAGDTKVVEKGKVDKLFISTAGIGWIPEGREIGGQRAMPGDAVLISGSLGDHGIAVLAARGDLKFNTTIQSDLAPLNKLIDLLLKAASHIHVLRDPTRGGLATALNEIAQQSNLAIELIEDSVPVKQEVQAACEMLGFDPLYVANEGKVIVILPESEVESALTAMHSHPLGKSACLIGTVTQNRKPLVTMKTSIGGTRIVDMLSGEILPRIC